MGLANSKSAVDVLSEIITNICVNVALNSTTNAMIVQHIQMTGFNFLIWTSQKVWISSAALAEVQVNDDLLTKIAEGIMQAAETKALAFMPAAANSTTTTSIKNILQNTITQNFITNCAGSLTAEQSVTYAGVDVACATTQNVGSYTKCIMKGISDANLANELQIDTSNTNKTTADSSSWFTTLMSTYGMIIVAVIIGAVIIIGIVAYTLLGSGIDLSDPSTVLDQTPNASALESSMPKGTAYSHSSSKGGLLKKLLPEAEEFIAANPEILLV